MLEIQRFLNSGRSLIDLKATLGITFNRHPEYTNLIQLKYSQLESPNYDPIVVECRGLILDEANQWSVVARGFDRFFNHGEGHAPAIDWPSARVLEKVDGSCVILWNYSNKWNVSTLGGPNAGGRVTISGINNADLLDTNTNQFTFADLFWTAFNKQNLKLPHETNLTFIWELTSPFNRIVCVHDDTRVTLLGARDVNTGQEYMPGVWQDRYPTVKEFPLTTIDEVIKSFDNISALSQEGYVIVDKDFHRIKVKHPQYIALHHMKEGLSPRSLLEVVRSGEISEVLAAFPEFTAMLTEISVRFETLVTELETEYNKICDIVVQKDFALKAIKTRCPPALFGLRARHVESIREYMQNMTITTLEDILAKS